MQMDSIFGFKNRAHIFIDFGPFAVFSLFMSLIVIYDDEVV